MALQQVYFEGPAAGASPCPWFQVRQVDGAAVNAPLVLGTQGSEVFWRATLNGDSWVDPFQSTPGFGYLSLLAVAWNGGHSSAGTIGNKAYDMRGARFSFEVRANALRLGPYVNLYFWMQFRDIRAQLGKGRYVNLSYLNRTLDSALGFTAPFERFVQQTISSNFVPIVVDFTVARPWDWIHMGSAANKRDIYDDCPSHVPNLDQVLRHWDWDCGIIAGYGPDMPTSGDFPYGTLDIRNLKLEVDDAINDFTIPPTPTVTVPASVASGATLTASIANGPANPMDWVGLYITGAPDSQFVAWNYLNGTHTVPSQGVSAADVSFTAPAATGSYNVRFFSNNSFVKLATSNAVAVS